MSRLPTLPVRIGPFMPRFRQGTFTSPDGHEYTAIYDRLQQQEMSIDTPPNPVTLDDYQHVPLELDEVARLLNQNVDGVKIASIQCYEEPARGIHDWHFIVAVGATEYPLDYRTTGHPPWMLDATEHRAMLKCLAGHIARMVGEMVQTKLRQELEYKLLGEYL